MSESKEQPLKILHASERKKIHEDALKTIKETEEKQRLERIKTMTDLAWQRLNKWLTSCDPTCAHIRQSDISISCYEVDPEEVKKMIALAEKHGYKTEKNSDILKVIM